MKGNKQDDFWRQHTANQRYHFREWFSFSSPVNISIGNDLFKISSHDENRSASHRFEKIHHLFSKFVDTNHLSKSCSTGYQSLGYQDQIAWIQMRAMPPEEFNRHIKSLADLLCDRCLISNKDRCEIYTKINSGLLDCENKITFYL